MRNQRGAHLSEAHHQHIIILLATTFFLASSLVPAAAAELSTDFYASSCPNVELLVRNTIRSLSETDPTIPGKLLRLLFHDCMVEGCDGSVLIQGDGTERSDPASRTLGGFEAVESAKQLLELLCPGAVSCADVLVLAARAAVEIAGGPSVQVPLGRRDGRISAASNVRPNIIDTNFSLDEMANLFLSKGLSLDDLVILSGAHTMGSAHCSSFSERFQEGPNGILEPLDSSLDKDYAMELIKQCPVGADARVTVSNDPVTAALFDNQYYTNLLAGKGLFQSDSVLVTDARTRGKVSTLSESRDEFLVRWAESFVKLTSIGVKTGGEGEIRQKCMNVNVLNPGMHAA